MACCRGGACGVTRRSAAHKLSGPFGTHSTLITKFDVPNSMFDSAGKINRSGPTRQRKRRGGLTFMAVKHAWEVARIDANSKRFEAQLQE